MKLIFCYKDRVVHTMGSQTTRLYSQSISGLAFWAVLLHKDAQTADKYPSADNRVYRTHKETIVLHSFAAIKILPKG